MADFGLGRQGHKYTVKLPDSKSRHLGPKRLTTRGNTERLSFPNQSWGAAGCEPGPAPTG